jgi:hypothetical protein
VGVLPWQGDGSVILGIAMGLIAHLVGRDVPRHFAFSGEVNSLGAINCPSMLGEASLRDALERGVRTLIMGEVLPTGSPDVVPPGGLSIPRVLAVHQVLRMVWKDELA